MGAGWAGAERRARRRMLHRKTSFKVCEMQSSALAPAGIWCKNWLDEGRCSCKVNRSTLFPPISALLAGLALFCPAGERHPKMILVDGSYNGREVTLALGEVVEISLAENRTTGFRWDLKTKPEPACSLVKSTFEPTTTPPGRGGMHRWQFRAVHSGTGKIEMEYRRPWEHETPPRQTFKLSVIVRNVDSPRDSTAPSE